MEGKEREEMTLLTQILRAPCKVMEHQIKKVFDKDCSVCIQVQFASVAYVWSCN